MFKMSQGTNKLRYTTLKGIHPEELEKEFEVFTYDKVVMNIDFDVLTHNHGFEFILYLKWADKGSSNNPMKIKIMHSNNKENFDRICTDFIRDKFEFNSVNKTISIFEELMYCKMIQYREEKSITYVSKRQYRR